jgi:hypothetical protein
MFVNDFCPRRRRSTENSRPTLRALRMASRASVLQTPATRHACKLGLEGIVSKRKGSIYRSGRSPDWIKMKTPACQAVQREEEEREASPTVGPARLRCLPFLLYASLGRGTRGRNRRSECIVRQSVPDLAAAEQ